METINPNIKLSDTQVKMLFEFTEKKFVHWYDLQIEIVDHLASAIEAEMQSARDITFESALEKIYKGFGIFGFAKIVQEKQNQLALAAKKSWWSEFRNMFRLPGLIVFLLIVSAVYTLSGSVSGSLLAELFFFIYITISLLFLIYIIKDNRLQRRLLLMQHGSTYFSLPFVFEFVVFPLNTEMGPISFTILLTFGILVKVTSFNLYKRVRSEAKRLYPSVFSK